MRVQNHLRGQSICVGWLNGWPLRPDHTTSPDQYLVQFILCDRVSAFRFAEDFPATRSGFRVQGSVLVQDSFDELLHLFAAETGSCSVFLQTCFKVLERYFERYLQHDMRQRAVAEHRH